VRADGEGWEIRRRGHNAKRRARKYVNKCTYIYSAREVDTESKASCIYVVYLSHAGL